MAKSAIAAPEEQKRPGAPASPLSAGWRSLVNRQELAVLAVLLLVGGALSLHTTTFLSPTNLLNVARSFSWFAIAAFGVSMVILIGGIDLSVGAVMALAGLVSAMAATAGLPAPLAFAAGLAAGLATGMVNGILIGRVGLPPFIITLGTMGIARGITLGLTGGAPIRELPPAFRALGQGDLALGPLVLPLPVVWMLTLALLASLLLYRTVLGRYIYTLGSNERALLLAGVPVARVKVVVYTLCGLLAACAGIIMTARLGVAAPTAAAGYELDIIAAAVIGGTSLFGGEGSIVGVLLGATLMQVVRNGLVLMGVPAYWQVLAIGAMILAVVLVDYWRRRRIAH